MNDLTLCTNECGRVGDILFLGEYYCDICTKAREDSFMRDYTGVDNWREYEELEEGPSVEKVRRNIPPDDF